ncbi:MAG: cyanophycinase [Intrasporangium sp.]|uniref:cyanophycinase n=1 Tax=Intrasporangium sp. TaxID=1925024 RepID=UPI0026492BA6|nr:cyanophycinase [Intrasporangium sp.]MDN5795017.1 cyanophycinase [Intrasporangium sp.]
MSPSRVREGGQRGWIVPIGGAEDKDNGKEILRRFFDLCGGRGAEIAVIPTASQRNGTGSRYEHLFGELGAAKVSVLDFDTRRDAQERNRISRIEHASGIFITGGNQLRLSTILGGTPIAQAIRARSAEGVPVGGTSAGASILSEHMIAGGASDNPTPHADGVRLAPGLGLTNRVVIDQHFRQRDRLGRLLAALAYNPFAIGLGVDEDTAAFISPENVIEVVGSGSLTVIDADDLQFSSMAQHDDDEPVCMLGVRLHVLTAGATFNLMTRSAAAGALAPVKD